MLPKSLSSYYVCGMTVAVETYIFYEGNMAPELMEGFALQKTNMQNGIIYDAYTDSCLGS